MKNEMLSKRKKNKKILRKNEIIVFENGLACRFLFFCQSFVRIML